MTKKPVLSVDPGTIDKYGNRRNISIPEPIKDKKNEYFRFSFDIFDRENKLFNLGSRSGTSEAVKGEWFISLLDCFKEVSSIPITELKRDKHDLHPVDWKSKNINASKPKGHEQLEYWQFRLNKGSGRVIGVKIENIFYVVWLDPYHNFIDSDGYGKAQYYYRPKTEFERLIDEFQILKDKYNKVMEDYGVLEDLLNECK